MVTLLSYCDLPEITEEALTRELAATGGEAAADVGPFYKQYHCIFGFVAQMCYVCVPLSQSLCAQQYLVSTMMRFAGARRWASPRSR